MSFGRNCTPSSSSKISSPRSELPHQARRYAYGWARTRHSYASVSVVSHSIAARACLIIFAVDVQPADDVAVRLNIDTEVVIAPKTRSSAATIAKEKHVLSEPPASTQSSSSLSPAVLRAGRQLLRLLPENVSKSGLQKLESDEALAWIHPGHFHLLVQAFPSTRVNLAVKSCPGTSKRESEDTGISAKVKGREEDTDKAQTTALTSKAPTSQVHIQASAKVPDGHVWVSTPARAQLGFPDSYTLLQVGRSSQQTAAPMEAASGPRSEGVMTPDSPVGMEKHLNRSLAHIRNVFATRMGATGNFLQSQPSPGLVITGASGSGKSTLVTSLAANVQANSQLFCHAQQINCTNLVNQRVPQLQAHFLEVFKIAAWHAPSIVIFDDIDRLMPAEMEHIDSFRSQHVANLFYDIANQASRERPILVIATCKSQESLHSTLSQSHFFGEKVNLLAPSKDARKQIFRSILEKKLAASESSPITSTIDYTAVATQTDGYLPVDLRDLVDRCIQHCAMRTTREQSTELALSNADVHVAQADFTPLSLREVKLQKSEVRWSDIGGLHDTRRVLRETLEWPTKYGAIFSSSPLRLRSG